MADPATRSRGRPLRRHARQRQPIFVGDGPPESLHETNHQEHQLRVPAERGVFQGQLSGGNLTLVRVVVLLALAPASPPRPRLLRWRQHLSLGKPAKLGAFSIGRELWHHHPRALAAAVVAADSARLGLDRCEAVAADVHAPSDQIFGVDWPLARYVLRGCRRSDMFNHVLKVGVKDIAEKVGNLHEGFEILEDTLAP